MKIGVGIDTGGTYTDGVIYDFDSKKILSNKKALTTKEDLSVGIGNVLDGLPQDLLRQCEIVSLSTTLATNACVEEKGGRGKLIFIGADKDVVERTGNQYGLPEQDEIFFLSGQINYSGEVVKEPEWDYFAENIKTWINDAEAVAIVQQLGIRNSSTEKKVKQIINDKFDLPAVCGHELFSDLNYIKRGSSALLNARLVPVIKEFLLSIKTSLKKRNLEIPIVIVRSDGSLMSEKFTQVRPVETLLCGPAASVMGAIELSKENNSIVIDMGGTTTDMALIKNGEPKKTIDGVKIGRWKTFVKSVYIDTFGLGGDSFVRTDKNKKVILGETRVIPLCIASQRWPAIRKKLKKLVISPVSGYEPHHEFFCKAKNIINYSNYSAEELKLFNALKEGPLIYHEAAEVIGKKSYQYYMDKLEQEGVIMRCGLTPTDMMHIKGDFTAFDREASLLGAEYLSGTMGIGIDALGDKVYGKVQKKIYVNVVRMLLEDKYPNFNSNGIDENIINIIDDSWNKNINSEFFGIGFFTNACLIGVGAPTHIFLPAVAKVLGCKYIIPDHASVANAVGAIVGSYSATSSVDIRKDIHGGFTVFGKEGNYTYNNYDDAVEKAEEIAIVEAREEIIKRGCGKNIKDISVWINEDSKKDTPPFFFGKTIYATAVSKTFN